MKRESKKIFKLSNLGLIKLFKPLYTLSNFSKILVLIISIISFSFAPNLLAKDTKSNPKYPILIFDNVGDPSIPGKLRSSKTKFPAKTQNPPTRLGLDELNISGSQQFTGKNLPKLMKKLKFYKGYVVDLRQESHGFLDNRPVSWYGKKNAANKDKTPEEIEKQEKQLVADLQKSMGGNVPNHLIYGKTIVYTRIKVGTPPLAKIKFKPNIVAYLHANTEEEIVKHHGLQYQRFYIQDFNEPSSAEIDRFVEFVKSLPKKTWLHFHCHAGKGRTTTFMVMYDMIKNAHQVEMNDIFRRQTLIGGQNLLETKKESSGGDVVTFEKRLKMLTSFYDYAKDPEGYAKRSWSDWLKN